jgi:16S rRNA (cytosine967-C5)-methyltransferase
LRGETDIKSDIYYSDQFVNHYYNEIIRFWNQLNFIIKKTLRSVGDYDLKQNEMAKLLYATYRIFFENTSKKKILHELPNFENNLAFLEKLFTFSWKIALKGKSLEEKLSIKEAIPRFLIEHLKPVMPYDFLIKNIKKLNEYNKNRKIYFRINSLANIDNPKVLIKSIKENFQGNGIQIKADPDIPELYLTTNKNKNIILKKGYYKTGKIIFQDKASAAVVYLLSPQPNEIICDICAAPGIKTSLISQYSTNNAKILAIDIDLKRLRIAQNLIARLWVKNALFINSDGIKMPIRYDFLFDKVLVDAPCTGSGALLAQPELKWRQNSRFIKHNIFLQEKLIHQGLKILKPGGTFVYSTCSLYPEEGELQIMKHLDKLEPLEIPKWISSSYQIKGKKIEGTGRLFPAIHNTQGFFIAKFKKKLK